MEDQFLKNDNKLELFSKFLCLALILLHSIICYIKTDYNIAVYIIMFFTWNDNKFIAFQSKHYLYNEIKIYSFLVFLFSFVLDIIWLVINRNTYINHNGFELKMFNFCYLLCIFAAIFKIILGVVIIILHKSVLQNNINLQFLEEHVFSKNSKYNMMNEENNK